MQEAVTPDVRLSEYLRNESNWKGSSSSVFYNEDGSMAGAFVTVYIPDRHRLAVMLAYLGVPHDLIQRVTGIG